MSKKEVVTTSKQNFIEHLKSTIQLLEKNDNITIVLFENREVTDLDGTVNVCEDHDGQIGWNLFFRYKKNVD